LQLRKSFTTEYEVSPRGSSKQPVFAVKEPENIGGFIVSALDKEKGCGRSCLSIQVGTLTTEE